MSYDFYDGNDDPKLHESDVSSLEESESFGAVECSFGCGFWRGGNLNDYQCPDCGGECHELNEDHFED
ncbi:hypothetical protein [Vibrio sp. R78045]|uniref:hypothetical protein n=1 Tax=Vibrio sp. R78045 TaxID=3093868 RepID=UPI0036F3B827